MSISAKEMGELLENIDYAAIERALLQGTDANLHIKDPYRTSGTLLYLAVYRQDPTLADIALRHGGDPNLGSENSSPLYKAVHEGYFSFCRQITEAEDFDPTTPLNRKAWVLAERYQNESPRHAQIYRLLQNVFDTANGWKKMDDSSIQHISRTPDQMIEVTTIFNFRAAKMKEITRDYATGRSDVESTYFADLPQNAREQVVEALTELQKQDGGQDVDPRSLSGVRHIQRSRGKQVQTKS
ncbi:MAG: hypothetical protein HND56_06005 [Pseudomonadota bacterium]|nr:ankyrin repeat domain-containing protein [Pseudomonadota bacterium]QKK05265.1 MAG: hypothetical protein HND56_06005 [Pseudomonadota bacterium]